jgi:hypothetical protein
MQARGAHRLDLRGVRLNKDELRVPADEFGQMIEKARPYLGAKRRILDRRVGENKRVRVHPIRRILGDVGDQVPVVIDVTVVESEFRVGRKRDRGGSAWATGSLETHPQALLDTCELPVRAHWSWAVEKVSKSRVRRH